MEVTEREDNLENPSTCALNRGPCIDGKEG